MTDTPVKAYIGLGSNLASPDRQLDMALQALSGLQQVKVLKTSSYYQTAAIGPEGQPDYLNAVVLIETGLEAEFLLDELQKIENNQGRVRQEKWGARTLDLDILLYGNQIIRTPRLTIPHEHMLERNFVLIPMQEIADESLAIPGDGSLGQAVRKCLDNPIIKWNAA